MKWNRLLKKYPLVLLSNFNKCFVSGGDSVLPGKPVKLLRGENPVLLYLRTSRA